MRTWRLPVFILAALVALSACSDDKSSEGSSSKETSPTATKHSSKASATKSPSDDKSDDQSGSKPHKPGKSAHPDKHKPKKSKLALSVHGKKTTIRPTDVYCKGGRGHIRHIIGKTHNQPPLVKAKGKHFAMVKPGRSRPYKANKPSGVSYGKNHVTFHKTSLGPATLNGSMICTKWQGKKSGSKPKKPKKPAHPDKHKSKKSKLALSVHGKKTTIRPTDVYCKGGRGHIRHIIGKTHNQPPLVKAKGKHFAMVKPGRSRPYKANKPSGVSYGKNHVTFHKTSLGPATLNGSMTCTKWEH